MSADMIQWYSLAISTKVRNMVEKHISRNSKSKNTGVNAVNRRLRAAITAAYASSECPIAVCGDQHAVLAVRSQAEEFLPLGRLLGIALGIYR